MMYYERNQAMDDYICNYELIAHTLHNPPPNTQNILIEE